MKKLLLIVGLLLLQGCAFKHFVDAKGRDCTANIIFPVRWDTCDTQKESLPPTKFQVDQNLNVNSK